MGCSAAKSDIYITYIVSSLNLYRLNRERERDYSRQWAVAPARRRVRAAAPARLHTYIYREISVDFSMEREIYARYIFSIEREI